MNAFDLYTTYFRATYTPSDFQGRNAGQLIKLLKRIRAEQRMAGVFGVHPERIKEDMIAARKDVMALARSARETGTLKAGAGFLAVWAVK